VNRRREARTVAPELHAVAGQRLAQPGEEPQRVVSGIGQLGHGGEARRLAHQGLGLRHEAGLLAVHHTRHGDRVERHLGRELRVERGMEEEHRLFVRRHVDAVHVRMERGPARDVLAVDLGGGVEAEHSRRGVAAHDHVVVAHEAETGLEARERSGRLAEAALAHRQQRVVADADRSPVHQLAAVALHPPVEQRAQRRGQHPVGQPSRVVHPVDAGVAIVVEQVHRVVVVVERGLDPVAVEAPQVAAVAERLAVARRRNHGHAGGRAVPQAEGHVRRRDRLDPQVLDRARQPRHQRFPGEREPHHGAGDAVVAVDLAAGRHRRTEALVRAFEERDLLGFGLGSLRHRVPSATIRARGSRRSSGSVSMPPSNWYTRST
jgi:hypothetical protein